MQRPLATFATQGGCLGAVRAYERWERVLHPFSEAGEHLFVDIERIAWPRPVAITTGVEHRCGAAALLGGRRWTLKACALATADDKRSAGWARDTGWK